MSLITRTQSASFNTQQNSFSSGLTSYIMRQAESGNDR